MEHCPECIPLYQVIIGLGTPVALQASLTVCPSSAVQFARISSKSGGPVAENSSLKTIIHSVTLVDKSKDRNTKMGGQWEWKKNQYILKWAVFRLSILYHFKDNRY